MTNQTLPNILVELKNFGNQASGWIEDKLSELGASSVLISKIIPLLVFAVLIWLATKISNKVLKFIIIILLIILIVAIILTFFPNGS